MKYSHVRDETNDDSAKKQQQQQKQQHDSFDGTASVASSKRRFRHKRINSELSEPLTSTGTSSIVDEELGSVGGGSGDPYFVFREDLQKKLELMDESLSEFLRIVHDTDTAVNTYELKDAKKQLKRHLKGAEATLKDVDTTVQVVETERDKFPHIDDAQLHERRSLVNTSRERIYKAKDELNSEFVKSKLIKDERNKAVRRSGDGLLGATTDSERRNTDFVLNNQAQTSLLMHQQDETLDELGDAVLKVGEMASTIHEEIDTQNKMLEDLDDELADAEEQLGLVMGKLAKFMKTKDKWQLRTILILSLVAFILLFLVLYS